jgi:S-formylglutathione hydrolase
MTLEIISEQKCFGGVQGVYRHNSIATGTAMRFAVYKPPQAASGRVPVLWFLAGLTCTEENFTVKAGAQRYAAEHGLMLVAPDTSPRGEGVADDPAYDFGQGAGFYLDATAEPWAKHFLMYSYIIGDLPTVVFDNFPAQRDAQGIFGHSMGGHGALTAALRNPDRYRAASAFAPIVAPSQVPWGNKALGGYLGTSKAAWRKHDTVALIEDGARFPDFLVDYGDADQFLTEQLRPELLQSACEKAKIPLTLRRQPGYDHSYYFISTFMADHLRWHADRLKA